MGKHVPIARARCAIYSRDTAIRTSSVPRFRRKNPFVKISSWAKVMGLAEYFCRPLFVWIFQILPYPRQNPMVAAQGPAWLASPWGHSSSSSAPCAVPMRLSTIDQHFKDEPCAKQRALLGIFSSRYSSRFSRYPISWSNLLSLPLVDLQQLDLHLETYFDTYSYRS